MLNRGISWLAGHEEFSVSRWIAVVYCMVISVNMILVADIIVTATTSTSTNTMTVRDIEGCYLNR